MAKKGLSLKAVLNLDGKQFTKEIKKIRRQIQGLGSFIKGAFALGSITAFGKQLVEVSKNFEDAMARVKAVSNASQRDFAAMTAEAKKLGETTRYTASEAAGALENLVRNGMTAQQATQSLSYVLQLAQANAIGLSEAADMLTNTMNMFGLSVKDAQRVNDVLSSTAGNTATNVSLLYEALVNAAPAANALGFSIEETSAAIGALAQKGVKGADAGTQLRMSLTKLADPKIIKKMQEMGVAIDEQTMKEEGLLKTVEKLKDAHLSLSDLVAIFSQKGAMGMKQLISAYDDFARVVDVTKNSAGTTARMFEQGVGSVRKEIDTLKSAWEGLMISLGNKTSGVLKSVIKLLQDIISNFKTTTGTILNLASVAVPLLMQNIIKLSKEIKVMFTMIKSDGAAALASCKSWVTAIITIVTWVGTYLYSAWQKNNGAMKEAQKAMAEVETETGRLTSRTKQLLDELQPTTDNKSLAGIVNELCALFPEFTSQIRNAAQEAGKTGNYDKLRNTLEDIITLQTSLMTVEANKKVISANVGRLAERLQKPYIYSNGEKKENKFAKGIRTGLENTYGKSAAKDMEEMVFQQIAQIIGENGGINSTAGKQINEFLKSIGVFMNEVPLITEQKGAVRTGGYDRSDDLSIWLGRGGMTINGEEFISPLKDRRAEGAGGPLTQADEFVKAIELATINIKQATGKQNASKINLANEEFIQAEKQFGDDAQTMYDAAVKFEKAVIESNGTTDDFALADERLQKYPKPNVAARYTDDDDKKKKDDAIENYVKEREKLRKQFAADAITEKEFKDGMADLTVDTYKAVVSLENFDEYISKLPDILKVVWERIKADADTVYLANQNKEYHQTKAENAKKKATQSQKLAEIQPQKGQIGIISALDNKDEENLKLTKQYVDDLKDSIIELQTALAKGDFDLVKDAALQKLEQMQTDLKSAATEAINLQKALDIAEIQSQIDELQKSVTNGIYDSITSIAQGFDRLYQTIKGVGEAFGQDWELEGLEKTFTIINAAIQTFEIFSSIIKGVQAVEEAYAAIKAKQAIQEQISADVQTEALAKQSIALGANAGFQDAAAISAGANAAAMTALAIAAEAADKALTGEAVASAAAQSMLLPYPANLTALGTTIGSLTAAFATGKGLLAFANGGIVTEGTTSGDNTLVRVNKGEMILNKAQQATLFHMINGQGGTRGNVDFHIRGSELVGVLNNYGKFKKG